MKIKVRPLNNGETFCCSVKAAKQMFKDTNATLNFAYYGRNYTAFNNTYYATYLKRIKGYVVANMIMESGYDHPIVSFYVVRERDFSLSMKCEFEEKCLPEFLHLYQNLINDCRLQDYTQFILVELIDNKLVVHRQTIR